MTNREFFTAIASSENLSAELIEHATHEIEKMDARKAQRSSKPTKKQQENEPILAQILPLVLANPMTASEVATAVEISTQKASALLRELVSRGKLAVDEISVKGKGKQKQYRAIAEYIEDIEDAI